MIVRLREKSGHGGPFRCCRCGPWRRRQPPV